MEIVYTIYIVTSTDKVCLFFPDAAGGVIFSQAVIIKEFVLVHLFYFYRIFSGFLER